MLVGIHGTLPILLLDSHIAEIVEIVGGRHIRGSSFLNLVQSLAGLLEIILTVERVGEIVGGCKGGSVLHKGLPVLDLTPLPVSFLELAVSGTHFPAVDLGIHNRTHQEGQHQGS